MTKGPFIGLLKGHPPFLILFAELHSSFSMDESYFQSILGVPFNVQTCLWGAWENLWAHRFTSHEPDEPESHFFHCRIYKILVELFKARTNTIFHQLKAGHLPNVADMMPFWLKKTICNPNIAWSHWRFPVVPVIRTHLHCSVTVGSLAVTTGPLGEL